MTEQNFDKSILFNALLKEYDLLSLKLRDITQQKLDDNNYSLSQDELELIKLYDSVKKRIENHSKKDIDNNSDKKLEDKQEAKQSNIKIDEKYEVDYESLSKESLYELAKERKKEIIEKYGGRKLSILLKVSHPAVSKWEVIPPLRCYEISNFGDFSLEYIRPDLNIPKHNKD